MMDLHQPACQSPYECVITEELIFPLTAYLNRMYGDVSPCEDMGIISTPEMFVSLQRQSQDLLNASLQCHRNPHCAKHKLPHCLVQGCYLKLHLEN